MSRIVVPYVRSGGQGAARSGQSVPVRDVRGPALSELDNSDRRRGYWFGLAPDDAEERWYFEAVQDTDGRWIAVRQLTILGDGSRRAYSVDHLEDESGFLTDAPLEPEESGLDEIAADEWQRVWSGA